MTIREDEYFAVRSELLDNELSKVIALETKYTELLLDVVLESANDIYLDFCKAMELKPFWVNYPPIQRGRAPSGMSVPWGEVGEKTLSGNLIRALSKRIKPVSYPGLPLGGDIRFATDEVLVHLDFKLTGPNDNPDEVVASPHQISGDGNRWNNGVVNSPVSVVGPRAAMQFQPELPPFYVLGRRVLPCLTYFLKAIYTVTQFGEQPLDYLELVCVPNGLLLFDGPQYGRSPGLLIPGKDIQTFTKKRTRIRLNPLSNIASWRSIKIVSREQEWRLVPRRQP